jgi:AcrR family transcriptional regulator
VAKSDSGVTLRERKQQLVRDAIWDAAIDLFARKGFDATTVDGIVEAAGVSRRSFFRYFASKTELMEQGGAGRYEALVTEAIRSCPAAGTAGETMRDAVLKVARCAAEQPRTLKILEIAAKYPEARAAFARAGDVHEAAAKAFARRMGKKKDRVQASLLAGVMLAVLRTVFEVWFDNPRQDISVAVERVFAGLGRGWGLGRLP